MKRMLTKFILTVSPIVKLRVYSSRVSGPNPMEIVFSKSVFTAPWGRNVPMISPINPPTTAASTKETNKKVTSLFFNSAFPYLFFSKKLIIDSKTYLPSSDPSMLSEALSG
jgi:hypothetical protein